VNEHVEGTDSDAPALAGRQTSLATTYDRLSFLWSVHSFTNDYVRFADNKTTAVVVIASGLIGALYSGGAHRRFMLFGVAQWDWKAWSGLLAFVFLALGVLSGAWSVMPRLWSGNKRGFVFWENVLRFRTALDYARCLRAESFEGLVDCLADDLFAVSSICRAKYRWLRLSICLTLLGGLLGASVLIL
jgi:hypothetical protein